MKWLSMILAVFTFFTSAAIAQQTKSKPNLKPVCNPYVEERLNYYFSLNAIEATQIVNNTDDIPNRSRTEVIKVGSHTVEWIVDVESRKAAVSVRINGDLITLDDKQSLNPIDGDQRLDLKVIGEWHQVKLYKLGDREIIALTMGPAMCTGLMCSVGAQLYYDATERRSEFFGRYRTDHEAKLYRFARHEGIYVIAANFAGDPHGLTVPRVITYELYKFEESGRFIIQKKSARAPYFIKHTTYPDTEFKGNKVVPKKVLKADKLEQNWLEKID